MKYALALLLLCLVACKPPIQKQQVNTKKIIAPPLNKDTSKYSILKFNEKVEGKLFDKNVKATTLSQQEIKIIETLIQIRVAEHNAVSRKRSYTDTINTPGKYFKQLLAIINKKGEKEVWVNCCCDKTRMSNWEKYFYFVNDGGSCFFNIKINLTKNKVLQFGVNGLA